MLSSRTKYILYSLELLTLVGLALFLRPTKTYRVVGDMESHGIRFMSARSLLCVEKGYLDPERIGELSREIDKYINNIENLLGKPLNNNRYLDSRIHFIISSQHLISTASNRYYTDRIPRIILSYANAETTPYIHELVHIIACDSCKWFAEGLAVYVNKRLNGPDAWPNYGRDLDDVAASYFKNDYLLKDNAVKILKLIGSDAYLVYDEKKLLERDPDKSLDYEMFYLLSGSFVQYLFEHIDKKVFMRIYGSGDWRESFLVETGKPVEVWKQNWLNAILSKQTK